MYVPHFCHVEAGQLRENASKDLSNSSIWINPNVSLCLFILTVNFSIIKNEACP